MLYDKYTILLVEWLEGIRYSTLKELGYAMISTSPLDIVEDTTTGKY